MKNKCKITYAKMNLSLILCINSRTTAFITDCDVTKGLKELLRLRAQVKMALFINVLTAVTDTNTYKYIHKQ